MPSKFRSFTVQVKVDALVSFTINAESLEDAILKARDEVKEHGVFQDECSWDDGDAVVSGVYE